MSELYKVQWRGGDYPILITAVATDRSHAFSVLDFSDAKPYGEWITRHGYPVEVFQDVKKLIKEKS